MGIDPALSDADDDCTLSPGPSRDLCTVFHLTPSEACLLMLKILDARLPENNARAAYEDNNTSIPYTSLYVVFA